MATDDGLRSQASSRVATLPNAISVIRLSTVPLFLWLFTHEREDAAVGVFAAGAFTDFLDGFIARRTSSITELGRLLDPLADRIFIVSLTAALVARKAVPAWLAASVVGRDVLVLALWPVIERKRAARIRVSFVGKTATALLLVGLTSLAVGETSLGREGRVFRFGLPLLVSGGVLYWGAALGYARAALARSRDPRQD